MGGRRWAWDRAPGRLVAAAALAALVGIAGCDDSGPTAPAPEGSAPARAVVPTSAPVAADTTVPPVPWSQVWCGAAAPVTVGRVDEPDLAELSGLAASRRNPGVLWAMSDSGGHTQVLALDTTGAVRAVVDVIGAPNVDWEDIAVVPGATVDRLVVADTGDNRLQRDQVALVVLDEPTLDPPEVGAPPQELKVQAERWLLGWPDGPRDAEALLVDPADHGLYLVTKQLLGGADLARVPAAAGPGAAVTLEVVGTLDTGLGQPVTAGVVSPDGRGVLLRSYTAVLAYDRSAGEPLEAALVTPVCRAPAPHEPQGEAITLTPEGGYLTASEGASQPIWEVRPAG